MEEIRKYLDQFATQTDADWAFFQSKLKQKTFAKGENLLKSGEVEHYLSFVETGILRLYIPGFENDLTFGFVFPGQFISAYDSFLTREPCQYAVQTLTHTNLWRLEYEDLQEIYAHTEIGNLMGRKNAERLFLLKSKRELSLLSKSPEMRYRDLFSERPELIRHIPLKYIASYIGVTPQALSRIRRRIS